jgi:polar amino acid transport system substrate-binding protein
MSFKKLIIAFCLLIVSSCGGGNSFSDYVIAIDPSWYPLELMGKESTVNAFSNDLLKEIARVKKISLSTINKNSDDLFTDLQKEQYDGALSSIQPYLFYEKTYAFSDLYLSTGPVLVVPENSTFTSLEDMKGKEVAIIAGSTEETLVGKYPGILIRPYDSVPGALNDLTSGVVDGMVLGILLAESYCQDLYQGVLKIATLPLNNEGLRLITLQNNAKLIRVFNEGLQEFRTSGQYAALAKKWGLSPSSLAK